MIQILGRAKIQDLPNFISVFATRGAMLRGEHGCLSAQLFKVYDRADEVMILFDWESKEDFEGFLADPIAKETMKAAGMTSPPEFTVLEEVGAFPS